MHTITICPKCNNDFMYHQTDLHLIKDNEVICQECYDIETIYEYIKEQAEHRGWENAEHMACKKFGDELTKKTMQIYEMHM